ncbi:MAG: FKBP-type peptidyl-prolyl cis-trans isomerase, partial [Candidatus Omnitrophica bacterium]|nr:FKBP-type peptidyl-prolyl cis-trans isomerase [Candidatus Omnitrophota bacterium]
IVFLLLGMTSSVYAVVNEESQVIENGKKVKVDFILTTGGKIFTNTEGKKPLEYVHGSNAILSELEKQLEGLKVGDKKEFTLSSEEAYGLYSSDNFREFPKSKFPEILDFTNLETLNLKSKEGKWVSVPVREIKDDSVILDLNHPLAGKDLHYVVTILDIQSDKTIE